MMILVVDFGVSYAFDNNDIGIVTFRYFFRQQHRIK